MKPARVKPKKPVEKVRQPKRWLLVAYCGLLIFLNGLVILVSFLALVYLGNHPELSHITLDSYAFTVAVALGNIFCLVNLLQMRRWGFWGYLILSIISIGLNVSIGTTWNKALLGLGGPIILFCLLYMGGQRSAWKQMSKQKNI